MAKYDIFISYRRDGGEFLGKSLYDKLTDAGYRVFFDVESLRSGKFNTQLYQVIAECQDFILLLPKGALDRCITDPGRLGAAGNFMCHAASQKYHSDYDAGV